jgi:hypothetical protein
MVSSEVSAASPAKRLARSRAEAFFFRLMAALIVVTVFLGRRQAWKGSFAAMDCARAALPLRARWCSRYTPEPRASSSSTWATEAGSAIRAVVRKRLLRATC